MKLIANEDNGLATPKKMLFAFYPFEAHGHINPALSMSNALRQKGHDTVIICINNIGYPDQRVICLKTLKEGKGNNSPAPDFKINKQISVDRRMIEEMQDLSYESDHLETLLQLFEHVALLTGQLLDPIWDQLLREVLIDLKPDVVVVDHLLAIPAIMDPAHGHKWVKVQSINPLGIYGHAYPEMYPAPYLGVSIKGTSKEQKQLSWKQYEIASAPLRPLAQQLAQLANVYKSDYSFMMPDMNISPYLNLYIFPRELDYDQETGQSLKNWIRIQSTNRPKQYKQLIELEQSADKLIDVLDIPQELRDFITSNLDEHGQAKRKLLFMSMGTIACMDLSTMQRLIALLSKTPYLVLVSKGARHQEYDLAPNMWGTKHVPQKEILLLVDLVITHGGNNTITECLYSGVPGIIVCPMFCDQLDNANRMEEKRLAARVDLNHPNSDEILLKSIEKVLLDTEMRDNIKRVSKELRQPNDGPERAAELLEQVGLGIEILKS